MFSKSAVSVEDLDEVLSDYRFILNKRPRGLKRIFNSFMRTCARMSFSDVGASSGNLRGLFNRRRRKLNVN